MIIIDKSLDETTGLPTVEAKFMYIDPTEELMAALAATDYDLDAHGGVNIVSGKYQLDQVTAEAIGDIDKIGKVLDKRAFDLVREIGPAILEAQAKRALAAADESDAQSAEDGFEAAEGERQAALDSLVEEG